MDSHCTQTVVFRLCSGKILEVEGRINYGPCFSVILPSREHVLHPLFVVCCLLFVANGYSSSFPVLIDTTVDIRVA